MNRLIGLMFVVLAIVLTGCSATGGGWLVSATGSGKATFAFQVKCTQLTLNAVQLSGNLEYADKAAGVRVHAKVLSVATDIQPVSCDDPFAVEPPIFAGTYRTQPGGAEGLAIVQVQDGGEPGPGAGDVFTILLEGPVTYFNSGPIQGGNIQVR
jgi:hypothetical protein